MAKAGQHTPEEPGYHQEMGAKRPSPLYPRGEGGSAFSYLGHLQLMLPSKLSFWFRYPLPHLVLWGNLPETTICNQSAMWQMGAEQNSCQGAQVSS